MLAGCQKILGIEEREVTTNDGGTSGPVTNPSEADCAEFCSLIEVGCPYESSLSAYKLPTYCPAVCRHFIKTGSEQQSGNNFECRVNEASIAKELAADPGEAESNCQNASPGGGGSCGTNCESYCQLYASICGEFNPDKDCLTRCPMLRDDNKLNAGVAFGATPDTANDTIQCRLAHLSAAAIDTTPHCGHAELNPAEYGPCNPAAPNCIDYCTIVQNVCASDESKQYDSVGDCVKACDKGMVKSVPLPEGTTRDIDLDTVACRRYHAYNAIISGPDHCNHAGPGGDGHCGKVCPAYCSQVAKACGANGFAAEMVDEAGCLANCGALVGTTEVEDQEDYKYNVNKGKAGGNNISCRLYHLVKAFGTPAQSCPSALGLGECQ